jgi:hypothetical protein
VRVPALDVADAMSLVALLAIAGVLTLRRVTASP